MARAVPFRWRTIKQKWQRTGWGLFRNNVCYARVSANPNAGNYYWYTCQADLPPHNSLVDGSDAYYTKQDAQAAALKYVKENLPHE